MRKIILKFNSNPDGTLERVVTLANRLSLTIESIEDIVKTKNILHKVVSISGTSENIKQMVEKLDRVPAVTIKKVDLLQ